METGYLNAIHDEEHFSSTFYNQGNGLDESEHMLFGEMIVPEIIDYDNLWQSVEDMGTPSQSGDSGTRKEDFQRMLSEWQHQLNYMQEAEAIKQILPIDAKTTQEVSDILSNRKSTPNSAADLSIDELFPPESTKETPTIESSDENRKASLKPENVVSCVKTKLDKEDPLVDVETVEEDIPPLLMAGDLTSLLEQFEATEKVNSVQPLPRPMTPPRPSSQTIRDALPAEVINRIKASRENHKKMISVIPAMPNKRPGKAATRMQDAGATLSRNKLLKLVTGGSSGESVQLDHDYCTSGDSASNSSRGYYISDSSEYPSQSSTPDASYSRLPEYCVTLASKRGRTVLADSGSRKDSGLESGENSEEDVPPAVNDFKSSKVILKNMSGLKTMNVVTENGVVIGSASVVRNQIPMVSVLKKNLVEKINVSDSSEIMPVGECFSPKAVTVAQVDEVVFKEENSKKKKLNLEEYRVRREERDRIRSQESSRANSPVPCSTPPAQPDSTTAASAREGAPKEKPIMLSVEVQTQTCDFIDLTSSNSPKEHEKSRMDRNEKRNDLKHRSYRSRHSSSSSSTSADSDRHHSHRRKKSSKSNRHRRNSVSRMWSRSRSRSSSRSHSLASSHSRSRSRSRDKRQKWCSRSPRRSNNRRSSNKSFIHRDNRDRSWHRGPHSQDFPTQEKVRQVEERRVIYVGRIDEGTSKADLRRRFQQFGPIVDISVHFRERGDNYGFVTFMCNTDAYKAVEHGNDDPKLPRYDLCFGGRRAFCKQRYADLDGLATNMHGQYIPVRPQPRTDNSFDHLLHEMKTQLRKRSSV